MKVIKEVILSTADLSATTHVLPLEVTGDVGATFSVIAKKDATHWYDFDTDVDAFVTSEKILSQAIIGNTGSYTTNINIPVATGTVTYTFLIIADTVSDTKHSPRNETRDSNNDVDENASTGSDSAVLSRTIKQYVNTSVTISGISHTKSGNYSDATGGTAVISVPRGANSPEEKFTLNFTLGSSDFIKARDPRSSDFEPSFTATVKSKLVAGGSGSVEYYFFPTADIEKMAVGMTVRGSHISGSTTIGSIENDGVSRSITFSTTEGSVVATDTLTFSGGGSQNIFKISGGTTLNFSSLELTLDDVATTVNDADCTGAASLTVFDVASVVGIKDDTSTMHGVNILTPPTVTNISSSTLTVGVAQILQNGQALVFKGASRAATLTGFVSIVKAGDSDVTLYLNLDNVLTVS